MEDIKKIKEKTISGMFWRFGERITAQLITFVVSIVLARMLMPEDYGIIALVTIFINIANVFVTNGLGTSLVQAKETKEIDFSTMLVTGMGLSTFLYIILFFTAPFLATIFKNTLLTPVLRVMGLRLPIAAINSIQQAYINRKMIYRKFFLATLFGTVISAFVGIFMAYQGFGVWALVGQYLTNVVIDTIVLAFTLKWRLTIDFSIDSFKKLFPYGWKITMTGLIGTLFNQLKSFVIGLRYTSSDLAFYNRGEGIPNLISNNIDATIESVLFPAISKVQDDKEKMKASLRRVMKMSTYIIVPMMFGLLAVSDNLIRLLYTEKWNDCIPFLKVICIMQCFTIMNTANLQAIKATGRSDISLKLEVIKKPIFLLMIILAMFINPFAIVVANTIYSIIALLINSYPNKKLLNYSIIEQLNDVGGNFLIAFLMMILVIGIGTLPLNKYLLVLLQVIFGILIYLFFSILFKIESFNYILGILKDIYYKRGINLKVSKIKINFSYWFHSDKLNEEQSTKFENWKTYCYLKHKYQKMLDEMPKKQGSGVQSNKVWWCWFQGEENALPISKVCLASLRKHLNDRDIVIITEENMWKYIELPDYIKEKYKKGIISRTHFSDLLRLQLLITYGGTWIDSTVLCTGYTERTKELFNKPLFLFSHWKRGDGSMVASSWFITAEKDNPILIATRDLLFEYWKKHNYLIHYFLFHLFFTMATEKYSEDWKNVKRFSNIPPHILQGEMFEKYSEERFEEIKKISDFHKLTQKVDLNTIEENSFYKYLLNNLK